MTDKRVINKWTEIIERINKDINSKGMTAKEIGKAAGCSGSNITKIRNQDSLPSLKVLIGIGYALYGGDFAYLFDGISSSYQRKELENKVKQLSLEKQELWQEQALALADVLGKHDIN